MYACVWHSLPVDVIRNVLAEGRAFTEELEVRKLAISTGKLPIHEPGNASAGSKKLGRQLKLGTSV